MATQVGNAYIPVRPDMSQFGREVESGTKGAMGSLKNFAKNAAITLGGAFAVSKGVDFLKGAVGAASDLNETVSKARTIFGPAAGDLERWASGSAKAFGQSQQQALDAAATFGNLFVQLGISTEAASGMSTEMVELASDFASFHNADPTEVINAQTAAFRGEYDALQRFVPTINAAAVAEEALRQTGKKTTKELTEQEKAIAVQTLMMEGAGDAVGDFARTSDSLANKQRIASAQWSDMTARIGQGLLPVMTSLMGFVSTRLLPGLESIGRFISAEVIPPLRDLGKFLGDNKEIIIGVGVGILATIVPAFVAWAASAAAAAAATLIAIAPVVAIGAAIAALTAGVIWAYQNVDWFRDLIDRVAGFLTGTVWPAIQTVARAFTDKLIPAIGNVIAWFGNLIGKAGELATGIGNKVSEIVGFFTRLPGRLRDGVGDVFGFLWTSFKGAINKIIDGWNGLEFKIPGFDPPGPGPKFGGMTIGLIDIPRLHTGGIYQAPGGAREGLALLESGEGVMSRSAMARLGSSVQGPSLAGVQIVVDRRVLGELMREDEYRYQLNNLS